ncbi:MAG: hypothetical protein JJE02_06440 [Propionibacteriales bacterium]|nr:hypothetical protein [Propionibacteriales bacterium]
MFEAEFVRDAAVMAAVFGMAGFIWFGWGQEDPPPHWRIALGIGATLSLLAAIAGGFLAFDNWGPESALAARDDRRLFGIVAGTEFALAAIGAAILGLLGRSRWTSSWICLVVGVHFVPLAVIFGDPGLYVLAALVSLAAVASVAASRRTGIHPSAIVAICVGPTLFLFAIRSIITVLA